MEKRVFEKDRQVCAYLAEQANWLLGRIEQGPKDYGKLGSGGLQKQRDEIEGAKVLIAEALGAISVICRDGASEKQLVKFEEIGAKMNHAVRF